MVKEDLQKIRTAQQEYFKGGHTLPYHIRKESLKKLRDEIVKREDEICKAVYDDFRKSTFESLLSETQFTLAEIEHAISNLSSWMKPEKVRSSLANFPSKDRIYSEPYGKTLIIAPWNYPFNLAIAPLIGAVAAGNTVVLKPSELTPNTSAIIREVVSACFKKEHVAVVEGDADTAQELLDLQWDYIFFTGSVAVGKIVYKAAAEHLTPVTLELGGKNPCIIDETAKTDLAAKRIVWGKFLNGGQTCIAPDYILIKPEIKYDFIKAVEKEITNAYGDDPQISPDYPRIVNQKHFNRLNALLEDQVIAVGGQTDASDCYIAPTVLDEPELSSKVMEDEIFGPILPVLSYNDEKDLDTIIGSYDRPLSLYVFSSDGNRSKHLMRKYSFGGGAINDTVVHIINKRLPFGGVGNSGIGAYHGKKSFDIFSHKKSVVKRGTWIDIPIRYAPYNSKLGLARYIKKLL
nr:aldehyde dehydrogenase [Robertkochia sp. 3YJGBD-33]